MKEGRGAGLNPVACLETLLEDHGPGLGPEWGSGGVYGLLLHRGFLYYTLSFEARARFLDLKSCSVVEYDYGLVGPAPRSGGDTYNASTSVDGVIYFGGWVHAPAAWSPGAGAGGGGTVSFVNKYSHVHSFDTGTGL